MFYLPLSYLVTKNVIRKRDQDGCRLDHKLLRHSISVFYHVGACVWGTH
jgi:hypothetical protein